MSQLLLFFITDAKHSLSQGILRHCCTCKYDMCCCWSVRSQLPPIPVIAPLGAQQWSSGAVKAPNASNVSFAVAIDAKWSERPLILVWS